MQIHSEPFKTGRVVLCFSLSNFQRHLSPARHPFSLSMCSHDTNIKEQFGAMDRESHVGITVGHHARMRT